MTLDGDPYEVRNNWGDGGGNQPAVSFINMLGDVTLVCGFLRVGHQMVLSLAAYLTAQPCVSYYCHQWFLQARWWWWWTLGQIVFVPRSDLGHPIIVFLLLYNYCVNPSDLTMTAHREQYHNPVKGQYHVPSVFVGRRPACPLLTDLKMINISTLLFQGVDLNIVLMKPAAITYWQIKERIILDIFH